MPYLIDTHAHLCTKEYDSDREQVIKAAFDAGMKKIINVGASVGESRQAVALAKKYENIWAAAGIHPNECEIQHSSVAATHGLPKPKAGHAPPRPPSLRSSAAGGQLQETLDGLFQKIERLAKEPKVIAIGETGLDFAPPPPGETARSKQLQMRIFTHLIEIAKNAGLPLIIHSRDAPEETYHLLSECIHTYREGEGKFFKNPGVIHCFTYSWKWAEKFLELGFYLSFTSIVTYPNAKTVQETAAKTPLEKMMLETDCPFLAPQSVRGQRNGPKNVIMIAEKIAELKGISFEKVAKTTTKNAEKIFGI